MVQSLFKIDSRIYLWRTALLNQRACPQKSDVSLSPEKKCTNCGRHIKTAYCFQINLSSIRSLDLEHVTLTNTQRNRETMDPLLYPITKCEFYCCFTFVKQKTLYCHPYICIFKTIICSICFIIGRKILTFTFDTRLRINSEMKSRKVRRKISVTWAQLCQNKF